MSRYLIAVLIFAVLTGCTSNNVSEDKELKPYFDSAGVTGCFGLFDNGENNFVIYNLPRYRDLSLIHI